AALPPGWYPVVRPYRRRVDPRKSPARRHPPCRRAGTTALGRGGLLFPAGSLLRWRGLADDGPAVVAEHQHGEPLDRPPLGRVDRRVVEPAADVGVPVLVELHAPIR